MFAQQALVSPPSTPRTGCTAVHPSSPRTGCTAAATSTPTKRILSRTVSMRGGGGAQTVVENTKKKGGNLYQVLRLDKGASPAQIKAAYRSLVKQFHPDTNKSGSVDSSGDFIEIHNAYATLSDPIAKARYDLSISLSLSIGIGFRCGNDDDCFVGARQTQTRRWETDQCW